jgi:hypothetical protein
MAVMKSPWHRNTPAPSQALHFHGLQAASPAQRHPMGHAMQARWNHAQLTHAPSHTPVHTLAHMAPQRLRKASWLPRLAGLLAFCALALGVMLAGSETCTAQEAPGTFAGSYSRSTLALITDSRADAAAHPHGAGCRHPRKASRVAHPKPAP